LLHLLNDPPVAGWVAWTFYPMVFLLVVGMVGVPASFLESVLRSAQAGASYSLWGSAKATQRILAAGAIWTSCFLAGPLIFAGVGVWYWLRCGEPTWVDLLILAELGFVAAAYWILAVLAVCDCGGVGGLNPPAVADMAHRLGWRGLCWVFVAAALLVAHGVALLAAVTAFHSSPGKGVLFLAATWMSGMFWSTVFCRWLGILCYRTRPRQSA
jgi:hypothetical protein